MAAWQSQSEAVPAESLERCLNGGTKLTRDYAKKLGKPVLHIYDTRKERIPNPDSLRLEIQALTDFLRSNKVAVLNVAGPRESKRALFFLFAQCRCLEEFVSYCLPFPLRTGLTDLELSDQRPRQ